MDCMKKIDDNMLQALKAAVEEAGSQSAFARLAGIGKQHISKYLKGDIRNIEHDTWMKLEPLIRNFYPPDYLFGEEGRRKWRKGEFSGLSRSREIPVISIDQAAGFDCTLEAFDSYALSMEHEAAPVLEEMDGLLAVKLSGESVTSWYSPGTIVYISSRDYPRPGKRVIAKLKNAGEIVFKVFFRKENKIMLLSGDGSGRDFIWEKPNENPFAWIYPVKYSFRDEDALDPGIDVRDIERLWK